MSGLGMNPNAIAYLNCSLKWSRVKALSGLNLLTIKFNVVLLFVWQIHNCCSLDVGTLPGAFPFRNICYCDIQHFFFDSVPAERSFPLKTYSDQIIYKLPTSDSATAQKMLTSGSVTIQKALTTINATLQEVLIFVTATF